MDYRKGWLLAILTRNPRYEPVKLEQCCESCSLSPTTVTVARPTQTRYRRTVTRSLTLKPLFCHPANWRFCSDSGQRGLANALSITQARGTNQRCRRLKIFTVWSGVAGPAHSWYCHASMNSVLRPYVCPTRLSAILSWRGGRLEWWG